MRCEYNSVLYYVYYTRASFFTNIIILAIGLMPCMPTCISSGNSIVIIIPSVQCTQMTPVMKSLELWDELFCHGMVTHAPKFCMNSLNKTLEFWNEQKTLCYVSTLCLQMASCIVLKC